MGNKCRAHLLDSLEDGAVVVNVPSIHNTVRNMLSLATSCIQSLGRVYRNKSLESVIGVYGYISLVVYSEYNTPWHHRGRALNTTVGSWSSL
jgi:hypothetical protein